MKLSTRIVAGLYVTVMVCFLALMILPPTFPEDMPRLRVSVAIDAGYLLLWILLLLRIRAAWWLLMAALAVEHVSAICTSVPVYTTSDRRPGGARAVACSRPKRIRLDVEGDADDGPQTPHHAFAEDQPEEQPRGRD